MKSILLFIPIFYSYITFSQSVGLRANYELSAFREMNNSAGFGLYVNIDDFSDKISVLLFSDFVYSNKEFNDCSECTTPDINSSYRNFSLGTGVFLINTFNNFAIKAGPTLGYYVLDYSRGGQISNWIEVRRFKKVGAGVTGNIELMKIFKSDFNLDLFISPVYLINISDEKENYSFNEFKENLMIYRASLGISYNIK